MADLDQLTVIYPRLLAARVRSDWQYRASFIIWVCSQALISATDFLVVLVVFHNVPRLTGWSLPEVMLLFGIADTAFGTSDALASHVERVAMHVKAGTFDRYVLRPMSPWLLLAADEFSFRRLGKIAQALVVLTAGIVAVDVDWTPARALVLLCAIVAGTVITSSIWTITSSLSFWTVETQEVANAFTYGGRFASEYPLDVYASWLRRVLVGIVPLAFTAYLPASWILGRDHTVVGPASLGLASPVVALVLLVVARTTWQAGLRHYRSTGS